MTNNLNFKYLLILLLCLPIQAFGMTLARTLENSIRSSHVPQFEKKFYPDFQINQKALMESNSQDQIFQQTLSLNEITKLGNHKYLSEKMLEERKFERDHLPRTVFKKGFKTWGFSTIGLGSVFNMYVCSYTDNHWDRLFTNILLPNLIKVAMMPIKGLTHLTLGEVPSEIVYQGGLFALTGAACFYGAKNLYGLCKLTKIGNTIENAEKINKILVKAHIEAQTTHHQN